MARPGQLVPRRFAYSLLACSIVANVYLITHHRVEVQNYVYEQPLHEQNTDFLGMDKASANEENKDTKPKDVIDPCQEKLQLLQMTNTKTSLKNWSFKTSEKCPQISLSKFPNPRQKYSLSCKGTNVKIVKSKASSSSDLFTVKLGDKCLEKYIDKCCLGKGRVPNVVHYIWYTDDELALFHFLSLMSSLRFVKPCLFLLHGDYIPKGKYWDYFISHSPNVIHVKRERPTRIFNHTLSFREHSSDIMRIEALKAYGGIYLDFDEIVLRPLEPLRKYEYVQGHELVNTMGSQLVMAKKGARFLDHWYASYKTDYRATWAWNALWIPDKLSRTYPDLIHVSGFNFTRPNWKNARKQIFQENYDWSTNYGMHLYARFYNGTINMDIIRRMNTTLGSVSRHVLFGNKELCKVEK